MQNRRVIQMEHSLVAQLQDRGAREGLRDRRDAIERRDFRGATRGDVSEPHPVEPGERVPVHDPGGRPG